MSTQLMEGPRMEPTPISAQIGKFNSKKAKEAVILLGPRKELSQ
jgi:hypothetical protein